TEEKYIMAIDQDTAITRAIIFDKQGKKVKSAKKAIKQTTPQAGWVEHDAMDIFNSVQIAVAKVLIETGLKPHQIVGLGITNQRETTVIWDKKTGLPIYPAVVWQSQQSTAIADNLIEEGHAEAIHEKTGLKAAAYFSATKIRWILDHVPHAQERAEKGELLFGTIDTWLVWKLTNGKVHVTDYSNASRTMLFNIHSLQWDADILEMLSIPRVILPKVKSNSEIYGYTEGLTFYGGEVPISGMAGDQQAALFGQMAFEPGTIKSTYGTGSFIIMNIGEKPHLSGNNLLTTIGYGINGKVYYALEGSIFVTGSAVEWLQDSMRMIKSVAESEIAATASKDENEVYVVPAFAGLGAPYWDSNARGAVFGVTRGTSREDLVKATLQSIAYQVRDVVDTMSLDSGIEIPLLKVDGAPTANNFLMKFQADILNTPVQKAVSHEVSALGAAFLAGLGVGYWKDLDEIKELNVVGEVISPDMEESIREDLYQGWQEAVEATQVFKHHNK
ncbi:MAG: glycerol kinase GlpK, partial [Pisciglobus halotolerans]|nr:glycerol kinase GlpK [Pisciglobus halotolerans]